MKNYEIRVFPKIADDGATYWTALYPSVPECIGGGDTMEEAIQDAQENLDVYLEFLSEEGKAFPAEDYHSEYSGKIALRVPKSTHAKLADLSENEGASINLLINNAIAHFLGVKSCDMSLDKKIDDLRHVADSSLGLQKINAATNTKIWDTMQEVLSYANEEVNTL
ncbi:MAG: type II toxin-antitoxin system HicB family antitoxin [Clostridia bacterium]|nr:type II toxin-antitoxin system HicB family antitoxin [Clostridia bacterium]